MTATSDVDTYLQQRASGEAAPPVPGGNGTSAETETVAVAPIEDAPPLTAPIVPPAEVSPPLKGRRKEAVPASGKTAAARVLPDPWRIVVRKVGPSAQEYYVGDYRPSQIQAAGGDVESFIRSQLGEYIEPGVNRFRVYLKDPKGVESPYGEVAVIGQPRQDASQIDLLERMERIRRETEERVRREAEARARAEIERLQDDRREMLERLKQLESAKSPIEALLLMQVLQPPQPRIDPSEIARQVAEAVRSALPPPAPPPPPPVDPLESVTRLLTLLRDQRQESFGVKELVGILPTVRDALGISKIEEETRKLRDRLEEDRGRGISELIEDIRALREATDLISGGSSGLDALLSPDGLSAMAEMFRAMQGGEQPPAGQQALPAPPQSALPEIGGVFSAALPVAESLDAGPVEQAAKQNSAKGAAGALAIVLRSLAASSPEWQRIGRLAMAAAKAGDVGWLTACIREVASRLARAGKVTPRVEGWLGEYADAIAHEMADFARSRGT